MRTRAALLATSLLTACTSMVMAEPRVLVSPYLTEVQVRGKMSMQSQPTPGAPLEDNLAQSMRTFGQDHHREDIGVRVDVGDGFAGFRIDYFRLDQNSARNGNLTDDWGRLLANDLVRMKVVMDELRVGYLEPVLHIRSTWRERPLSLQLAVGGVLAHRDMSLAARTDDGQRSQNAKIVGDSFYPAARARASWRDLAFDIDYAACPELVLSGDFEGLQQDFETRISYTLAQRDVTFFAGYRYSELPAKGQANGFAYDADLRIDGFQFGVSVTF